MKGANGLHTMVRDGGDPADRVRRAARSDITPAALLELARDPDVIVRATVALNASCDPAVEAVLASDSDERVRALLAGRIARLLTGLTTADQDAAADHVHETIRALAADEAVRVRVAIADELAEKSDAPREIVLKLAQDAAKEVNDRVIRLSPLLSDADLLAILTLRASPSAATSVASRSRLSAVVADAIIDQADGPTIKALLHNNSACIREATLDVLIGRAEEHVDWHAPLVRRPSLSAYAVRALSDFITADLLRVLATRSDLDPAKLEIVRQRLKAQTDDGHGLMVDAQEMREAGTLNEAALLEAATAGNTPLLLAQLAVSSGIALSRVERVLELRSAKALVSLVWRSGFSMSLAEKIQNLLASFGPTITIAATSDGGFPLSENEMTWQIELMTGTDAATG